MAFSNTKLNEFKIGGLDVELGTFTNATTAGGDVATEMARVEFFLIQGLDTAVIADADSVNETLPTTNGTVTVVTTSNSETYGYISFGGK